jgi:hypothetical protein
VSFEPAVGEPKETTRRQRIAAAGTIAVAGTGLMLAGATVLGLAIRIMRRMAGLNRR